MTKDRRFRFRGAARMVVMYAAPLLVCARAIAKVATWFGSLSALAATPFAWTAEWLSQLSDRLARRAASLESSDRSGEHQGQEAAN